MAEKSEKSNGDTTPEKDHCGGACHASDKEQEETQIGNKAIDKTSELEALVEKYKNDYLYLRADFDNYKKHSIKERSDYMKYGSERIIIELLNVIDNFERALDMKVTNENFSNFAKGVEMTAKDLRSLLERFGVSEISSQGKPFDPNVHEALSSEESKEIPAGHIVRVFRKPYKLHDKLIRPGQVIVAKQASQ